MSNELKIIRQETSDLVQDKVRKYRESGELCFPANYSPDNAIKSAWLMLQETVDKNGKPALETCTKPSIANALLSMVIQGLNPDKKQCYFIPYGQKLTLMRSYFGNMHIAKAVDPTISDISAEIVYKDDVFEYEKKSGRTVVTAHKQKLGNRDKNKIVAAYCTVVYRDGRENTTIMTFDEIKESWKHSARNPINSDGSIKSGSTHALSTEEMAKRTVINRACKNIINSSDDRSLLIRTYHADETENTENEALEEIEDNANSESVIIIDPETGEVLGSEIPETPSDSSEDDLP